MAVVAIPACSSDDCADARKRADAARQIVDADDARLVVHGAPKAQSGSGEVGRVVQERNAARGDFAVAVVHNQSCFDAQERALGNDWIGFAGQG